MDFYKILGVARDATPEEIKKAFREKAKRFHPDRNKSSQEFFKKVTLAYETLIDPEKRKKYDLQLNRSTSILDKAFSKIYDTLGFTPASKKGKDLYKKVFISLKEGFLGSVKTISYTRKERCSYCEGTGITENSVIRECSLCRGEGFVKKGVIKIPCSRCKGRGFQILNPCTNCSGKGYIHLETRKTFKIPEGIKEGDYIKIKGGGDCGKNGGDYGDLYLIVKFQEEDFQLKGKDVYKTVYIPKKDLKKGDVISVPYFLEDTLKIEIPKEINSETTLKVKNRGYKDKKGNTGDFYINIIPLD